MVAFNFGDAVNNFFQSFDVNWFRFAKSCISSHQLEEAPVNSFASHELLGVMT